jgi:hypothetical protein
VRRSAVEPASKQGSQRRAPPSPREIKIAAIGYAATSVIQGCTPDLLVDDQAERQIHRHAKTMSFWIDLQHPKGQLQVQYLETGLAADHLSDRRGARRIDAEKAHVEYVSPSGRRCQKRPDPINGSLDYRRRAARIAHRTPRQVQRYLAISLKSRSAARPFEPLALKVRSRLWLI